MQPLAGIHILDFSTLLPGPLASLFLAEAGAEVIKIERPGMGDEMRTYEPRLGADSANFALLNRGKDGAPSMPLTPIADIAGGSYPAVVNILLALLQRQHTGEGSRLDVSMTDSLFVLAYWGLANGFAAGRWPRPRAELLTGGSPRYQVYRTADGGYLSAAPIEQRFWHVFCRLIGLDERFHDDSRDPAKVIEAVAVCIIAQPTDHWRRVFAKEDACCAVVATLAEAVEDPHFRAHNLFDRQ